MIRTKKDGVCSWRSDKRVFRFHVPYTAHQRILPSAPARRPSPTPITPSFQQYRKACLPVKIWGWILFSGLVREFLGRNTCSDPNIEAIRPDRTGLPAITSYEPKRVIWVGEPSSVFSVTWTEPNQYSDSPQKSAPGDPNLGQDRSQGSS